MNSVYQNFLNKDFKYNFEKGPNVVTSESQAIKEGINCIGLMHLLLKQLFNVNIPGNLRVLEIFNQNPYFETLKSLDGLKTGDILFLGRKDLPEYISKYKPKYNEQGELVNEKEGEDIIGNKYAGYHTAMFTGEKTADNQPLVVDIQKATDKIKLWNLKELMKDEKYQVLYKIKRLIT